jgi:hypothetical protein
MPSSTQTRLPRVVEDLFWDVDRSQLSWDRTRDFITRRILVRGSWQAIEWLRSQLGDEELRKWIIQHQGRGLEPRQLRFWQIAVGIDPAEVDRWIAATASNPWVQRLHPRSTQQ